MTVEVGTARACRRLIRLAMPQKRGSGYEREVIATDCGGPMSETLGISPRQEGDICTVVLEGDLDVYSSAHLKKVLTSLIAEGSANLMLDLRKVDFMDSSGLGVLVSTLRRSRELGGGIRLVCAENGVLKILRITGLDRVFPIIVDSRS